MKKSKDTSASNKKTKNFQCDQQSDIDYLVTMSFICKVRNNFGMNSVCMGINKR